MTPSLGGPKMSTRDWSFIEERLLSPSVRLGEAITRLRQTNYDAEAERLLRAQQALQDECRAVRNLLRAGQRTTDRLHKGQKVRVKSEGISISAGMGGLTGQVIDFETRAVDGNLTPWTFVEVCLDGPVPEGISDALVDEDGHAWFNEYELEAVDGSNP